MNEDDQASEPAVNALKLPKIIRRTASVLPGGDNVPPLLQRVVTARGIRSPDELELGLGRLPAPVGLPGLDAAVEVLCQAIAGQQSVVVVGDYDADGATSTAVMVRGLRLLGLQQVSYQVPDRFKYGYGLSVPIVDVVLQSGARPDVLVTVDNGIASVDGVAYARQQGMQVIVTDHHLPGETLPEANALVNPRLPGCSFAGVNLAGVGVAFYLLLAVRAAMRERGMPGADGDVLSLLDLVALGTVADLVPMDAINRVLVEQGLRRIRAGRCVPGIAALLREGKRVPERVVASDMGFAVAPRLNAAGRLACMSHGVECLLVDDAAQAEALARELNEINLERRQIEVDMRAEAEQQVARLQQRGQLPEALCLFDPAWHEGVVGILASRVKEQCHRPVIAFAHAQSSGLVKGSGRSIKGLHLRDALDLIAKRHPDMLDKFGGHAMAAGLTLHHDHLDDFRDAFIQVVREQVAPEALEATVETDGLLSEDEITLQHAELLQSALPWGQGFPEPLFDGDFEVLDQKIMAEKHLRLTLGLPTQRGVVDGILFNAPVDKWPSRCQRVRGVYRLGVNEYRGRRSVQLYFQHLVPMQGKAL